MEIWCSSPKSREVAKLMGHEEPEADTKRNMTVDMNEVSLIHDTDTMQGEPATYIHMKSGDCFISAMEYERLHDIWMGLEKVNEV